MSNELGMEEKKYRFAKDNLLPFFLKQHSKDQTSVLEKDSVVEKIAEMRIFPYITADGIEYGKLKEPGISWYYCDAQQGEDVKSTDSYRIFANSVYSDELFQQLRQVFGTDGSGHVQKYSDEVLIKDLINRMGKEKKYSNTWWTYACDAFDRWNPSIDPGTSYKNATKGIQEAYFLYVDDKVPLEYQQLLERFKVYKDIKKTAGYQSYIGRDKEDAKKVQDKIRFLTYLGIPTSFVERSIFGTVTLAAPVQVLIKNTEKIIFPVKIKDGKNYDLCKLAEYIVLHVIYEEDRNVVKTLLGDKSIAKTIPILNINGDYIRARQNLFYFGGLDYQNVPDNPLNYLLVDKEYNRDLKQMLASEIESVERYEDYSLNGTHELLFYKWVWQYTKNANLIQSILLYFDKLKKIAISDSSFAFDVLDHFGSKDTDYEGNESIQFKNRNNPSSFTFTIHTTVGRMIEYRYLLNALFKDKDYKVYITLAQDDIEKAGSWIEDVKNRILAASHEHYSEIDKDAMWKNIYTVNAPDMEDDAFGQYIAVDYINISRIWNGDRIIVVNNRNSNSYLIALCEYIKDHLGITLDGVTTDWNEQYKALFEGIRGFLMKKEPLISDEEISFSISDMADIQSLGDEIAAWKQMESHRDSILGNRVTESSLDNWKQFLNSKYHGRCQLCGNRTVSGADCAYTWTYRMVKQKDNTLANMESNMFCLCPSCHGKMSYGFMGRDLSQVMDTAKDYVAQMRECLEECPDDPEDSHSIISEFADDKNEYEGFRKPVVCDVLVNGEEYPMKFSWEHFIHIAFLLSNADES